MILLISESMLRMTQLKMAAINCKCGGRLFDNNMNYADRRSTPTTFPLVLNKQHKLQLVKLTSNIVYSFNCILVLHAFYSFLASPSSEQIGIAFPYFRVAFFIRMPFRAGFCSTFSLPFFSFLIVRVFLLLSN